MAICKKQNDSIFKNICIIGESKNVIISEVLSINSCILYGVFPCKKKPQLYSITKGQPESQLAIREKPNMILKYTSCYIVSTEHKRKNSLLSNKQVHWIIYLFKSRQARLENQKLSLPNGSGGNLFCPVVKKNVQICP